MLAEPVETDTPEREETTEDRRREAARCAGMDRSRGIGQSEEDAAGAPEVAEKGAGEDDGTLQNSAKQ